MKKVSILNHVIGPVMRGPSSSHTAGPWRIAKTAVNLLGAAPEMAVFSFDPSSSLAVCYRDQGSDLAFAAGLLGRPLTDRDFPETLSLAPSLNLDVEFKCAAFTEADHPNSSLLELSGGGKTITVHSRSTGGGSFVIASFNGVPVEITGESYIIIIEEPKSPEMIKSILDGAGWKTSLKENGALKIIFGVSSVPPTENLLALIAEKAGEAAIFISDPVMAPLPGEALFKNEEELASLARERGLTMGDAALASEAALLGASEDELKGEMGHRLDIMLKAVKKGLAGESAAMKLLRPFAGSLWNSLADGKVFTGGPHARAAVRAFAALHECSSGGVVCAAPTGGAAGVLPGVMATLAEDFGVKRDDLIRALWAAGAVGCLHDLKSTFAAEVAGCQVEIGAAGAMAAAAVTEAAGGTVKQGCDAAATVFQNMMGSVCDLIQGVVEIPCHSRNGALASQAFLCADMVLAGYESPVSLDETIDAVDSVGRMMPEELRCTSRGGIALCPSALAMPRLDKQIGRQ